MKTFENILESTDPLIMLLFFATAITLCLSLYILFAGKKSKDKGKESEVPIHQMNYIELKIERKFLADKLKAIDARLLYIDDMFIPVSKFEKGKIEEIFKLDAIKNNEEKLKSASDLLKLSFDNTSNQALRDSILSFIENLK